jgi:fibro-slime domain-containing protein
MGMFGGGGAVQEAGGAPSSTQLVMTIRDFKFWDSADPTTNPDFENAIGDDRGIVQMALGADHKPVYVGPMTATTHGKTYFDQWYNDVPGTNINVQYPILLTSDGNGTYSYDSLVSGVPVSTTDATKMFFPIDDGTPYATAFGDQWANHNYAFTVELHTIFVYRGGESFSFSGDDDVFVFINGAQVIDLGGVHDRENASVQLDSLGLTKGQQYPLDLFSAERHNPGSNLSFTTTLGLQQAPVN